MMITFIMANLSFRIKGRERLYSGYGIWLYLAVADFLVGLTFLPTEVTGKRTKALVVLYHFDVIILDGLHEYGRSI